MAARLFISYRTADGRDKATALARELGARFGDEQVFLDKDDLRGGSVWREEIARTLGGAPVLLLLWTPLLLVETDASGRPRVDDPEDPVRRELAVALESRAHVIPLLCDGVEAPPADRTLPAPFDRLGGFTWRRLRAYDWQSDIERLVADLHALGLRPLDARRRRITRLALGGFAMLAIGLGGALAWRLRHPAVIPLVPSALSGTWIATVASDPPFALTLARRESQLVMNSEPIPMDERAGWSGYRAFWLRLTGTELRAIRYRGSGTLHADPGRPLAVDIDWKLFNGEGDTQIDSGHLHLEAAAEGQNLAGPLWSNGDQAERQVVLRRPH